MKKRGFTLIEIIAVIGVLSVIFSIGIASIKQFKTRYKQIEISNFLYETIDMISYGKSYCASNDLSGNVKLINNNDYLQVYLIADNKVIKNIKIKEVLRIKPFDNEEEIRNINLRINEFGYVEPTTIKFINEKLEEFIITVQVGGNVILVKEGGS
ncbi:type II secretion system protein [Clostridium cibarium]|uniref:Type II secretion system protein n=1 Tax=Clostridium cibarium TaxID=2762247 RepID=A0ABR8PPC6_9CLOT|nr:type II secretion system protein [Clostridium cibarium]MBD7910031.1 type II secretion system protein [Clostridium cibarium]